jgi:hypothetical protein
MTMDLAIAEGQSAGMSQVGIFEVTDAMLKAKLVAEPGNTTRPTNFDQEDGFFIITATKKK